MYISKSKTFTSYFLKFTNIIHQIFLNVYTFFKKYVKIIKNILVSTKHDKIRQNAT